MLVGWHEHLAHLAGNSHIIGIVVDWCKFEGKWDVSETGAETAAWTVELTRKKKKKTGKKGGRVMFVPEQLF